MKQIRQVVWQRIRKAQRSQKDQYDKHGRESKIEVGDLIMLKVETTFKLDRTFCGPYRIFNVTSTCASIQPINSPNEETIFGSLQCLSCCHGSMLGNIKPWLRHGKKRRHHHVWQRADTNEPVSIPWIGTDELETRPRADTNESVIRSGRVVKRPIFCQVDYSSCLDGTAFQHGKILKNVIEQRYVSY